MCFLVGCCCVFIGAVWCLFVGVCKSSSRCYVLVVVVRWLTFVVCCCSLVVDCCLCVVGCCCLVAGWLSVVDCLMLFDV